MLKSHQNIHCGSFLVRMLLMLLFGLWFSFAKNYLLLYTVYGFANQKINTKPNANNREYFNANAWTLEPFSQIRAVQISWPDVVTEAYWQSIQAFNNLNHPSAQFQLHTHFVINWFIQLLEIGATDIFNRISTWISTCSKINRRCTMWSVVFRKCVNFGHFMPLIWCIFHHAAFTHEIYFNPLNFTWEEVL